MKDDTLPREDLEKSVALWATAYRKAAEAARKGFHYFDADVFERRAASEEARLVKPL